MSHQDWIVCERSNRWAAALRLALAANGASFRLRETRHLSELDAEVDARPAALVAIEVRRDNFAASLAWLAAARRRHVDARCVALVDRSLSEDLSAVGDALAEAGAQLIATSPRRLAAIVELAARHAKAAAGQPSEHNLSLEDRVWASLPWQAT